MALLHYFLLMLFLYITTAEYVDPSGQFCNQNTNISSTSQISANIASLLPRLVSGASQNGFIATSNGKAKDQVYGLAQCRGDVSGKDC